MSVYRTFVARFMSLQHQLHAEYHSDRQLRHRLLNSVDISTIPDVMRERTLLTSHQLINRVANRLSTNPRTAGSVSAHLASHQPEAYHEYHDDYFMYTLGQSFRGDATQNIRVYDPKPFSGRGRGWRQGSSTNRSLNCHWMRGLNGCFVCGKDHRANDRHSRQ